MTNNSYQQLKNDLLVEYAVLKIRILSRLDLLKLRIICFFRQLKNNNNDQA